MRSRMASARGIADYIVPAVHWELTGDQCCAAAVTFFGDLE